MTIQDYFKKRKLSESSVKLYLQRLRKLNAGVEPTQVDYLQHYDDILEQISTLSNNTQRGYLITIVQALKSTNKYDDEKDIYEAKLAELEYLREEQQQKYQKSDKEKQRMCSFPELQLCAEYWIEMIDDSIYNNQTPDDIFTIYKNALISLLYTEQPPIRLEYASMHVINNLDEIVPNKNYLFVDGNEYNFILQDFKTKSKGAKTWTVTSTKLKNILKQYLQINTSGLLFPSKFHDGSLSTNAFGKLIPKVFESVNKKITLNILRHIYISHHVDHKILDKNAAIANAMCHSIDTQKSYIKV